MHNNCVAKTPHWSWHLLGEHATRSEYFFESGRPDGRGAGKETILKDCSKCGMRRISCLVCRVARLKATEQ